MDEIIRRNIENFDIPNPFKPRSLVDFELCIGLDELRETIHNINVSGYTFLVVTQDREIYTVFFRRPAE